MNINIDEAVSQMKLTVLADLSTNELQRHRGKKTFDDVKEIYRLNHNIVERLRRNRDRLRHVLGDAE